MRKIYRTVTWSTHFSSMDNKILLSTYLCAFPTALPHSFLFTGLFSWAAVLRNGEVILFEKMILGSIEEREVQCAHYLSLQNVKKVPSTASRAQPEYILCQNAANALCNKPILKHLFFCASLLSLSFKGYLGNTFGHALSYEVKYHLKHMPASFPLLLLIYRPLCYICQLPASTKLYFLVMQVFAW